VTLSRERIGSNGGSVSFEGVGVVEPRFKGGGIYVGVSESTTTEGVVGVYEV
jgi:hypothetical protein